MTAGDRATPGGPTDREDELGALLAEHYLYVNMRDIGCNCRERCPEDRRDDYRRWHREHVADLLVEWLRDRDAAPTAPERVEWGVRLASGVVHQWTNERQARERVSYLVERGLPASLVRRTVTEWVAVDE